MTHNHRVVVRLADPEFSELQNLVFSRYPDLEWASFARFGWRESDGSLVLTLAGLDSPGDGDLDRSVSHVKILEPYTLRIALTAETHNLCVGVIHSHPEDCIPCPSRIDDDMDGYYCDYFQGFAPNRPYLSLIFSQINNRLVISGRVFWKGNWLRVTRFVGEAHPIETWMDRKAKNPRNNDVGRVARLVSAFGMEAAERLRRAAVAVVGAGGTGSMAIEVLARAGVGKLVIVDPDYLSESNLERVHGSVPADAKEGLAKVVIAKRHVASINKECEVDAILGALPQKEIIDAIVGADVAIGCTDQQHSRLSLSDLSFRYLVPVIDTGVLLEGQDGKVTGQVLQMVRFFASDPCALCRGMVSPRRIAQELMSEEEKEIRQAEAEAALKRGEDPDPYWQGMPQINTVGYLTGIAGSMAAAYAIGLITNRFEFPFSRMQMNLVAPDFDVQEVPDVARENCSCRAVRGWADQGNLHALISAPNHWPAPQVM